MDFGFHNSLPSVTVEVDPNAIKKDGSAVWTADQSLGGNSFTNVGGITMNDSTTIKSALHPTDSFFGFSGAAVNISADVTLNLQVSGATKVAITAANTTISNDLIVSDTKTINGMDMGLKFTNNFLINSGSVGMTAATNKNTAFGFDALKAATATTSRNTVFGFNAGKALAGAAFNVAMGADSLLVCFSGGANTAVGFSALSGCFGDDNTAIGAFAGDNITSGDDNIIIGKDIAAMSATADFQLNIGDTIFGDLATNKIRIGGSGLVSESKLFTVIGSTGLLGNVTLGDATTIEQDIEYRSLNGNWQVGTNDDGNGTESNQFYIFDASTGNYFLTVQRGTGRMGVGPGADDPNATLDVGGIPGASVGGFASGQMHVTSSATAQFSNAVITGHSNFNTNTQLWYLGSTSSSNDEIALINRQNAALAFYTNNIERLKITNTGTLTTPGDLDLTTGTGGVFKFNSNAILAGQDGTDQLELGHGGTNAFINNTGAGGIDVRFDGSTFASFTSVGHLHLTSSTDQKHNFKIQTNNNANASGMAWENSGGNFSQTIFRKDIGSNNSDLFFAIGSNANIDLLTDSIRIDGAPATLGNVEFFKSVGFGASTIDASAIVQIDSTVKGFLPPRMTTTQIDAITSPATGLLAYDTTKEFLRVRRAASWCNIPCGVVTGQFSHAVSQKPSVTTPVSLNFDTNDITLAGISHSTTVQNEEFTATIKKSYTFMLAPQWERTTSGGTRTIDFFIQKSTDGGTVFTDVANSNVKVKAGANDSNVIPLMATIAMDINDIVRFQMRISATGDGLGTVFTAAEVGPPTIPATPAQILTIFSGD